MIHPDDRDQYQAPLQAVLAGEVRELRDEIRFLRADGSEITVAVRATPVRDRDGEPLYLVCHLQDVTEERRQEAHLRHLANHDPLTGLVNRRRFEEDVDRAVAEGRRYEPAGALLVVDLDNFKYVNDTYGHAAGDRLLVAVAQAMRARLRDSDIIGRLGGDEFGVILPRATAEEARSTAADLLTAIRNDACVDVVGRSIRISASVGVSPISGEGLTAEQLLAEADVAMYDAKEAGRDRATLARGRGGQHGPDARALRLVPAHPRRAGRGPVRALGAAHPGSAHLLADAVGAPAAHARSATRSSRRASSSTWPSASARSRPSTVGWSRRPCGSSPRAARRARTRPWRSTSPAPRSRTRR